MFCLAYHYKWLFRVQLGEGIHRPLWTVGSEVSDSFHSMYSKTWLFIHTYTLKIPCRILEFSLSLSPAQGPLSALVFTELNITFSVQDSPRYLCFFPLCHGLGIPWGHRLDKSPFLPVPCLLDIIVRHWQVVLHAVSHGLCAVLF